jgi:hypothetical protein
MLKFGGCFLNVLTKICRFQKRKIMTFDSNFCFPEKCPLSSGKDNGLEDLRINRVVRRYPRRNWRNKYWASRAPTTKRENRSSKYQSSFYWLHGHFLPWNCFGKRVSICSIFNILKGCEIIWPIGQWQVDAFYQKSHALLSTEERVLMWWDRGVWPGTRGYGGRYSSKMGVWGTFSVVILSYWFLYIVVWDPDRDFSPPRKDYTPFTSSFHFAVAFPLPSEASTFCFTTFICTFWVCTMNFLSDTEWIGLRWMNGSVYTPRRYEGCQPVLILFLGKRRVEPSAYNDLEN